MKNGKRSNGGKAKREPVTAGAETGGGGNPAASDTPADDGKDIPF
jgi:hypothetical protein